MIDAIPCRDSVMRGIIQLGLKIVVKCARLLIRSGEFQPF